jgi:hypothetical protein
MHTDVNVYSMLEVVTKRERGGAGGQRMKRIFLEPYINESSRA